VRKFVRPIASDEPPACRSISAPPRGCGMGAVVLHPHPYPRGAARSEAEGLPRRDRTSTRARALPGEGRGFKEAGGHWPPASLRFSTPSPPPRVPSTRRSMAERPTGLLRKGQGVRSKDRLHQADTWGPALKFISLGLPDRVSLRTCETRFTAGFLDSAWTAAYHKRLRLRRPQADRTARTHAHA
jgi:hypothetical protein